MPRTKCPTVRSGGTTSVRSARMPTFMISRASMIVQTMMRRPGQAKREPRPINTDVCVASGWGRNPIRCEHRWLWVPAFAGTTGGEDCALLVLHRLALDKGFAALHLVGQRRLVDLDHDGVGLDAEVLHQRLRDVAHHAGLLFIGAAGGHADGDFRHCWSLPFLLLRHSCHLFDPHPEERTLVRVSKDALIVLMVRDGTRAPPHHEV